MYAAYTMVAWPVFALCGLVAIYRGDWGLMRCAIIMALGQFAIDVWAAVFQPVVWQGQPSGPLFWIYAVSAIILTIRPSGKLCSIMAALCLWGVAISALHYTFHWTYATDSLYFQLNLLIGWFSLFVLAGGASGERGRRFLSRFVRSPTGMADTSNRAGLAR